VLDASFPSFDGVDAGYGPRRTLLDTLLVEAARDADAEVRERVVVDELTFSDERVTGVRGRSHGGGKIIEESRLVVGADGKHSLVARSVKEQQRGLPFRHRSRPVVRDHASGCRPNQSPRPPPTRRPVGRGKAPALQAFPIRGVLG
jgi:flavin-dependent dehydrogenase